MENKAFIFYDIESFSNLFTICFYHDISNTLYAFYLCDTEFIELKQNNLNDIISDKIYEKNPIFDGSIKIYNLKDDKSNRILAHIFGLSDSSNICDVKSQNKFNNINKKNNDIDINRLICTTDKEYKDNPIKYPYLVGYNSYQYDTTMLTQYLVTVFEVNEKTEDQEGKKVTTYDTPKFHPTTAKTMRYFNDKLFTPEFKSSMPKALQYKFNMDNKAPTQVGYKHTPCVVRNNMLRSGRHIDVAKLNESMYRVALKRLLGLLGRQILESEELATGQTEIKTFEQFLNVLAYNTSDVIYLKTLLNHNLYKNNFELKEKMLEDYPSLVYTKKQDKYEAEVSPKTVRFNRLNVDSTSAQFASNIICPYEHLDDIETVSYMYPHKNKLKEGQKQINVLEYVKEKFYAMFPQEHIRSQFDGIYNYYKAIEGKNFNDSQRQFEKYEGIEVHKLSDIEKPMLFMPYYNKNGEATSCVVNFSTGGLHGQEINLKLYEHDLKEWNKLNDALNYVKKLYPNPLDLKNHPEHSKEININGEIYKSSVFLKSGSTKSKAEYKDLEKTKPSLFKLKVGERFASEINKKYTYTSVNKVNHEDFESYYPGLLISLNAFYNKEIGEDIYFGVFELKRELGKKSKSKDYTVAEQIGFFVKRNGTKLVLNSASGAGDAQFDNSIRMNNTVISMRIIGQLYTFIVGATQAYHGALIPSTNTDGLYTVMNEKENNILLEKTSKDINVKIEPETMFLISKDSNNRIEFSNDNYKTSKLLNASGGSVGCYNGPTPSKSLNHPAIIDYTLVEYMKYTTMINKDMELKEPFNKTLCEKLLHQVKKNFDSTKYLIMMQNIIASSKSSNSFIFGYKPMDTKNLDDLKNEDIKILQHYNRVFIMKDGFNDAMNLQVATAKAITPATIAKRKREGKQL